MTLQLYLPAFVVAAGFVLIWRFVTMPDGGAEVPELDELDDPRSAIRQMELDRTITERLLSPVSEFLVDRLRRYTPVGRLESVQHKLVLAGLENSRWTAESVLGMKILLTLVGSGVAAVLLSKGLSTGTLVQSGMAVAIGYLVPESLLTRKVDERQGKIQSDLPDVIDQITISVEAGLGFDGAMQRAGEEGRGPVAEELLKVVNDLQLGMSRDEALGALIDRTDVPDLRQFVLSIRQAARYGLPIGRVLRVQSNEIREKRRARAEEKAMQIPVKITFPLVFFILPALFIVILGPAGIQLAQNF